MKPLDWGRTVDELGPRLYRYFKFKGARDLASDLTQETFVRLVRKIDRYDSARGPLVAYALGLAQNIWLEHTRKVRTISKVETIAATDDGSQDDSLKEPAVEIESEIEARSEAEQLKRQLTRLPQTQQDILYFYFDEELTTREIGDVLEMPEGTVKSHLHRAKESLRELIVKERS